MADYDCVDVEPSHQCTVSLRAFQQEEKSQAQSGAGYLAVIII